MEVSKGKLSKDYLGIIFSTSITDNQIDLIKDKSRSVVERKEILNKMLSDKQKSVLKEFRKLNNSNLYDYSFLNQSLLDEFDYKYIIDQIVI